MTSIEKSEKVTIYHPTKESIEFDSSGGNEDVVLVQVPMADQLGQALYRTIVTMTQPPPSSVAAMELKSSIVDDQGDFDLFFEGVPLEHVLLKATVMEEVAGKPLDKVIKLQGMTDDARLKLHGGWIRRMLEQADVKASSATNSWKVFLPRLWPWIPKLDTSW